MGDVEQRTQNIETFITTLLVGFLCIWSVIQDYNVKQKYSLEFTQLDIGILIVLLIFGTLFLAVAVSKLFSIMTSCVELYSLKLEKLVRKNERTTKHIFLFLSLFLVIIIIKWLMGLSWKYTIGLFLLETVILIVGAYIPSLKKI